MDAQHTVVIKEITKLLLAGNAHASFKDAVQGLNPALRGVQPENMPYSIWQLVEHIRIAQWDMLQFCRDATYQSPKWPDAYWPEENEPESDLQWEESLELIDRNLHEFIDLIKQEDIYKRIEHGEGQTILMEALQMADHTAYHVGEIVAIRRILQDWK